MVSFSMARLSCLQNQIYHFLANLLEMERIIRRIHYNGVCRLFNESADFPAKVAVLAQFFLALLQQSQVFKVDEASLQAFVADCGDGMAVGVYDDLAAGGFTP